MRPSRLASTLCAAALVIPLAVQAQTRAPGSRPEGFLQMDTTNWDRVPTADELTALYPSWAIGRHLRVQTEMTCHVRPDGLLADCLIVKQEPIVRGFDHATIQAARYFRMKTELPSGATTAGLAVRIPLIWSES